MKKSTVRFMACAIAATLVASELGVTGYAEGDIISEEEISITAALDEYIANHAADEDTESEKDTTVTEQSEDEQAATDTQEGTASSAKYPEFEGKALANVSGNLNIREAASEDAERIGKLPAGAVATVLGTEGDWTQIKSGSVTGYVKSEYLVFGDEAGEYAEKNLPKMAVIQTTTLKVREEQTTDSTCVTMVPGGEEYAILEQHDEWTEIEIDDATTGYVSNEYIDVTYSLATAVPIEEEAAEEQSTDSSANNSSKNDSSSSKKKNSSSNDSDTGTPSNTKATGTRKEIVNYALQFVGNPYVYGGSSLTNGTDCSGFTMSVYKHFGISLPHNSAAQSKCGKSVSISNVQPGDLIFYGSSSGISHVALYIGNGQVVHASSSKTGIKISKYNYKTPKAAVSLLN